jgi:hypothetical protein
MRKFVTYFAVIVCVAILAGCSVNPSKVDKKYSKEFMDQVTYIKDQKTGLCFAIVATRMTGHTNQNGISWTWVPCEPVEKFIEK